MRILLTSDLHYKLKQYDWLLSVANRFDAVVVAGDHVDQNWPVPPVVQIAALRASLAAIADRSHVFACSGNHDLNARNESKEKTADWLASMRGPRLSVDGDSVVLGGTLFTVCPWWDGPATQAQIAQLLDEAAKQRTDRWVWIYHAPPQGPLSWTGKRHFADAALAEFIAKHQPTAVLCGHIHEAPFRKDGGWNQKIGATWLFNAGRQD